MEGDADASKLGGSSMSSCLPLLVFQHNYHDKEEGADDEMLMLSLSKQSLHKNLERGLLATGNCTRMCWSTPQGWILLVRAQDHDDDADQPVSSSASACLWNPSTGDKLPLPDIITEEHRIRYHSTCILSHKDPTHPGCFVVLFSHGPPEFWYCQTTAAAPAGEENSCWRLHSYNVGNCASVPKPPKGKKARRGIRPKKRTISMMASLRGKICFYLYPGENMCAIDFSSCTNHNDSPAPRFQKFSFGFVSLPEGFSSGKDWMVESQDQLFAVTMGFIDFNPNNIGAIEVYRRDGFSSSGCWRRVHDIGDVVFLLEMGDMAASCSASALGLKPNQIFFMKNMMDDDADLCIFDLETNTQEITQVHHHDVLILCRPPFWIVPPS